MRIEEVTYKCDGCGARSYLKEMPFCGIRFDTPTSGCGPYDFCSLACFIKKFNQCMDEDGIEVSIREEG